MEEPPAALPRPTPVFVAPPKAITTRATPLRDGIRLPDTLRGFPVHPWLTVPKNLGMTLAAGALLLMGLYMLMDHHREVALKDAVLSAKADALKPVARQMEIIALTETPEAIRKEAQSALSDDPLLAYFRAQECVRVEQGNLEDSQLIERARTRLAALAPAGTPDSLQASLKAGDLEAAQKAVLGLLRQTPDAPELRNQARIINLNLAQFLAGKEHFDDAKDCLLLVRAMFPQEKIWQAKLKLLETIQTMPKADRPGWIQMLG